MKIVKKGFTLIELLAVIAILAIILLIAVPSVINIIGDVREKSYENEEKMLIKATELYMANNLDLFPTNNNEALVIGIDSLISGNYIDPIMINSSESCEAFVDVIKNNDGYEYVPYLNCEEVYKTADDSIDSVMVLLVAGGGSGASTYTENKGGGGGAGGLVFTNDFSIIKGQTIDITVGAGGEAIPDSQTTGIKLPGLNGENSAFGTLVALGGGGGRRNLSSAVQTGAGGSGGGGHYAAAGGVALQPTSLTFGYGNSGGSGSSYGFGGGGAGTPGIGNVGTADGRIQLGMYAGGQGLYEVAISSETYNFYDLFGETNGGHYIANELWFAGGGGGGICSSGISSYGAGGYGGGGRGAYLEAGTGTVWGTTSSKGEDGLDNTGGGGGGARGGESGAGGSGIVLVRYEGNPKAIGGEITIKDGYTIHAFKEVGDFQLEFFDY